jgi:hypothetical protein
MNFSMRNLSVIISFIFLSVNAYNQCAICTLTNPASLPNPIGPGTVICITSNQTYGGGANLTGGSIHICSGAKLRINGAVSLSATSSITTTDCSSIEVHGNIHNNNPAGLLVLDNCNCATSITATGPIFGFPVVCAPLPVELLSFNVRLAETNTVHIDWTTASENNNSYFTVERSTDALQWMEVKRVTGAGFSNEITTYTITDEVSQSGLYYYRLKQTDFDGKEEYFDLRSIEVTHVSGNPQVKVYPNPASEFLAITLSGTQQDELTIEMINLSGRVVYTKLVKETDSREQRVDLTGFENGVFIVRVHGNNLNESAKIVVNH